jgi:diguanylate cyclase (GGDEF)-like protein
MPLSSRNKKRIGFFSLVPIFTTILVVVDDLTIRIITGAILVIYVGFIIFLRDSIKEEGFDTVEEKLRQARVNTEPEKFLDENGEFVSESDEGFKILSTSPTTRGMGVPETDEFNLADKARAISEDTIKRYNEIISEELPENVGDDEEFSALLKRILHAVKDSMQVHSALFFLFNSQKEKITLREFISNSREIQPQKFELSDDVLSRIVENKEPEILDSVNSRNESDLIRYYNKPQGVSAFCGVPFEYNEQLVLVLAIDSKDADAFGVETIYILGRFIRIISSLISLFEEKHSVSVNENRLNALLKSVSLQRNFTNTKELGNYISTVIEGMVDWDFFTFILFDVTDKKYKISKVVNKKESLKYVGENLEIDENNSLVGKVLRHGEEVYSPNMAEEKLSRFASIEDIKLDGSFMAIPLIYEGHNFGIITLESMRKDKYTKSDIIFLKKVFHLFAYYIQCYSGQKFLQSLIAVDVETGVFNRKMFVKQLKASLIKDKAAKVTSALVLIKIDEFINEDSLFEKGLENKVIRSISKLIVEELNDTNIIGRIKEKVFGVYFYGVTLNDVTVWAEKLRTKISRKTLNVSVTSKQKNFTVSLGIVLIKDQDSLDDVLNNAQRALDKAVQSGGNKVVS